EQEYCLLAAKRLHLAELDTTIQGYQDGVFWERNTLSTQKQNHRKKNTEQLSKNLALRVL
ncbi:unnamed protein product, partial [marine sediment metagenome]